MLKELLPSLWFRHLPRDRPRYPPALEAPWVTAACAPRSERRVSPARAPLLGLRSGGSVSVR